MSQEEFSFDQLMRTVMQEMGSNLMELATGDGGGKAIQTRNSGEQQHLRIRDDQGKVLFQVSGKDEGELAWQLVLACLHDITIDQLKALHKRPLRRALEVAKGNG